MKTKLILSIIAFGFITFTQGQNSSTELSSSTDKKDSCKDLDTYKSTIQTQGDNTANYLADSILLMDYSVEIAQATTEDGIVSPSAQVKTTVSMYVPETDYICIKITDLQGRTIISSRRLLEKGTHLFKYEPGASAESFFTAYWHGTKSSIKIEHIPSSQNQPISLEYLGHPDNNPNLNNFQSVPGAGFKTQETELYSGKKKGL